MAGNPKIFDELIAKLIKLPGIGRRSAERIAFYLMHSPFQEAKELSEAIFKVRQGINFCRICNNFSEGEICSICNDTTREKSIVCVVEEPKDLLAIEKAGTFKGLYHVLMGSIAPLEGRGPDDLKIKDLISRIKNQEIKEIIIATDSDMEGETTALYLTKLLKPTGLKITRIGFGLPVGGSVEYTDASTLAKALESRREI
ncbi:MAG: recombination mediator RecR [Candidatus Omnitrophota bacterium]|nr:recombination mediator RecR [Candidatus Omnitrophota bacterium]